MPNRIVHAAAVLLALAAPALAAPAHRQPRPADLQGADKADPAADPAITDATRASAAPRDASATGSVDGAARAQAARDKVWDARMKSTMSSICRGC